MPVVQLPDGRVVQFPDDMPEAEINSVLAKEETPAPTESISAQPERGIGEGIRNWLAGLASERRIAKGEQKAIGDVGRNVGLLDLGKAGLAGLAAGLAPVGAIQGPVITGLSLLSGLAGGALGGELGKVSGEAVAPGVGTLGQEAGEFTGSMAGGLAPGGLAMLLGRFPGLAPALTRAGLKDYVSLAKPKTTKAQEKMIEQLGEIKDQLPVLGPLNPRGRLERVAEEKLKDAGKRVRDTYNENVPMPEGYKPVIKRLEAEREANIRVPEREVVRVSDKGEPSLVTEPAIPKSEPLNKSLGSRLNATQKAQKGHQEAAGEVTARDYLEARKTADEMATQAKANVFEKSARELNPKVRALRAEREAMAQEMHRVVKGGKAADDAFAAWSHMKKAGQSPDAGTFLERWLVARVFGGITGTVLGAGAAKTAFWRSISGKTKLSMAKALERGDQDTFTQLLAAASREASGENDEETP